MAESPTARRRATNVALSLQDLRDAFEQQQLLSVKDAITIIHEAQDLLNQEANMVVVHGTSTYVFGDIHGQFYDLMRIIDDVGLESIAEHDFKMVFLGDYVDRGAFSSEVILYLLLLKVKFPKKVFLLRGNHECETISSFYGFRNECRLKYGISVYYHFLSCFQSLPIAALLKTPRGDIFCVHGGISPDLSSIYAIDSIDRRRELPTDGPLCDLLWADPAVDAEDGVQDQPNWTMNEVRGCSYYFSSQAMFAFLEQNRLLAVVRAHEYAEDGYMFHFNSDEYKRVDPREDKSLPPLITVFSAANYCDRHGNLAGYLIIQSEPFQWQMKQIEAVVHPAPPLPGAERGSDIWRQFHQTLPFLPASKDFFEDILTLSRHENMKIGKSLDETPAFQRMESLKEEAFASIQDPDERRRRQTSEMHPQAIRRVLDEEASKWIQSEDGDLQVFSADDNGPIVRARRVSLPAIKDNAEAKSKILSNRELETIKLVFSLLDTDGSMTLNEAEVKAFIFNILGERISDDKAEEYLVALDFDHDGVVDFGDILSWAAVMKINHESLRESSPWRKVTKGLLRASKVAKIPQLCLLLAMGAIARDMFVGHQRQLIKAKALRIMGYLGLMLYLLKMIRGDHESVWSVQRQLKSTYKAMLTLKSKLTLM